MALPIGLGLVALAAISAALFGWGRALTLGAETSRERRGLERKIRELEAQVEHERDRRLYLAGVLEERDEFLDGLVRRAADAEAWRTLVAALAGRMGVPLPHELDPDVLDAIRRPLLDAPPVDQPDAPPTDDRPDVTQTTPCR